MAIRSRLFVSDEELGKRDDDHRPSKSSSWIPRRPHIRPRRVLGFLIACICIYVFVHNVPVLGPINRRYTYPYGGSPRRVVTREFPDDIPESNSGRDAPAPQAPRGAPPPHAPNTNPERSEVEPVRRDFEGSIRFFLLAASLHSISRTNGHRPDNKNVLFAASDLKTAADIIPIACEMARWKRNHVHIAIMGRDEMALEEIQRINGAEPATCSAFWHDARPDYAEYSTDARMEVSVAGALGHIENFMHPQAVITGSAEHEDDFFARGVKAKAKELHQTHIELPAGHEDHMSWLARLEASALHAWHTATIDILVQAPEDSSGSLVRCLKSLERADYGSFMAPRLTVELPHTPNEDTMIFMDEFQWPPRRLQEHLVSNQLILRRRIPDKRLTAEEASIRFVESFYPADSRHSHVLVLSPQAEVSPAYYHYLKYYLLEYKYGSHKTSDLFGLSLETPSMHLNGSEGFKPPDTPTPHSRETDEDESRNVSFLWQAPNTNAALIFGDKWLELHSFLSQIRIAMRHPATRDQIKGRKKSISEQFPAWAEHLLDLMRARGYSIMYPNIADSAMGDSLAIVHNELYQIPEEFVRPKQKVLKESEPISKDTILEAPSAYLKTHHSSSEEDETLSDERPLLKILQGILPAPPPYVPRATGSDDFVLDGDERSPPLPSLDHLPMVDFRGDESTYSELMNRAEQVAVGYRQTAGGCTEANLKEPKEVVAGNAQDLFCIDHADLDEDEPGLDDRREADTSHSKPTQKKAAPAPSPTLATKVHGGDGAAAVVNAVTNPEGYEATARAGMKAKQAEIERSNREDSPVINADDHALTDLQRAELEDWNARQRQGEGGSDAKASDNKAKPGRANPPPPAADGAAGKNRAAHAASADTTDQERLLEVTQDDYEAIGRSSGTVTTALHDRERDQDAATAEKLPPRPTVEPVATFDAGARPRPTDDTAAGPAAAGAGAPKAQPNAPGAANPPADARGPRQGRIPGWDSAGYDESVRDELAAAHGRVEQGASGAGKAGAEAQAKGDADSVADAGAREPAETRERAPQEEEALRRAQQANLRGDSPLVKAKADRDMG